MSTNGKISTGIERFLGLIGHPLNQRTRPEPMDEPAPLSPVEQLSILLGDWATKGSCRDHFMPFLDELIAEADAGISQHFASHPHVAYMTGQRDALRNLRAYFKHWAGTTD